MVSHPHLTNRLKLAQDLCPLKPTFRAGAALARLYPSWWVLGICLPAINGKKMTGQRVGVKLMGKKPSQGCGLRNKTRVQKIA